MRAIIFLCAIVATTTAQQCECGKFYQRGLSPVKSKGETCLCLPSTEKSYLDKERVDPTDKSGDDGLKAVLLKEKCELDNKNQDLQYQKLANRENVQEMEKLQCYGAGTQILELNKLKCECKTIGTGDDEIALQKDVENCKVCRDDYINWPDCDKKPCESESCEGNICNDREFNTKFCSMFDYEEIAKYPENWIIPSDPKTTSPDEICCTGGTAYDKESERVLTGFNYKLTKASKARGDHCCNNNDKGFCNINEDCIDGKKCVKKQSLEQCPYDGEKKIDGAGEVHGPNEKKIVFCEEPGQTCCGHTCCDAGEICRVKTNGYARFEWVDTVTGKTVHEDDRMECTSTDVHSSPAIIRFAVFPALLIIALLVSTALVIGKSGMGEITVAGPAILVIVCSLFLVVSQFWASALLLSLGSLLAIGAQAAKSEYRHVFSVIVQFLFFAAFVGGLGVGSLLVGSPSPSPFPVLKNSYSESWPLLSDCSNYYGTFNQDRSPTQPWDQQHIKFYGICSYGYQSFLVFMLCTATVVYFIQLVASATLTANK